MTNNTTVKKLKLMPTCCVWIGRTGITTIFIGRLVCSFPSVQNGYLSIYLNKYMYMFIYLLYIYISITFMSIICISYIIYIGILYIYMSIIFIYLLHIYICYIYVYYLYSIYIYRIYLYVYVSVYQ